MSYTALVKMKGEDHVIVAKDEETAFDKMQHPFMIQTLNILGVKRMYLNIIKATDARPQLTSYSVGKREGSC